MTHVLSVFASSGLACLFSIAFGVAIMLSVANVAPTNVAGILLRELIGGICLLAPAVAQRWRDDC